jgi:peptidoglycan-associated lipoprotein
MKISHMVVGLLLVVSTQACQSKKGANSGSDYSNNPSRIAEMGTVYFDFDSASISGSQTETLRSNASYLKNNSGLRVNVEGNCDERGTNEYNLALGDRRARATKDYLVNLGIDPSRLNVMSFGEEKPACTGSGEDCWAQNRRAEFTK